MRISISGVMPEIQQIRNIVVEDGRFFNESEVNRAISRLARIATPADRSPSIRISERGIISRKYELDC